MNTLQLDVNQRYTYADYLTWFDETRRELFDGLIQLMSAPTRKHQKILGAFHSILYQYFRRKSCEVYVAPFDVRLPKFKDQTDDKQIYTVVQPDICVICDHSKLDKRGCIGAPDWIIEIVSPSNSKRDVKEKYALYQEYGVREYWTVLPKDKLVYTYLLNSQGKYENVGVYAQDEQIKVNLFEDLYIDLVEVFEDLKNKEV